MTRGWDKGVDYETAKKKIERLIRKCKQNSKSRCYAYILYIQLANGSRISEAIRAAYMFSRTLKDEVEVELSKGKMKRTRLMVRPEGLDGIEHCRKVYEELLDQGTKKATAILADYARKRLGINTHTLRYAFITNMLSSNVSPILIARIVGHKKLDHILTYTQTVKARELLKTFVNMYT